MVSGMSLWLIAFGATLIFVVVLLAVILGRLRHPQSPLQGEERSLLLLQQQVESLRGQFAESLERQLGHVTRSMDERLKVVGEVQAKLGGLEEASRQMVAIGRDIAGLQNILRAPKVRGGIGEFFLENLLSQMLPRQHYELQHAFRRGDKVDAVILLGRMVPVDAKFPLDNFKRFMEAATDEERRQARKCFATDVRKHVDAIACKYILPEEGTFDFALMYIPAENVYYETIVKPEEGQPLLEYALERRVVPVSPNTFFAYLQVIVLGLRGMHVEESAREILARLSGLHVELDKYRDDFRKLGMHLKNAAGSYDLAEKRLDRMSLGLERLQTPAAGVLEGEKPSAPAEG